MQENEDTLVQDELTALKARADVLGVQYHPSIGLDKLRAKVAAAMSDDPAAKADAEDEPSGAAGTAPAPEAPVESEGARLRRLKQEANRLVRIRLTCMNPAKKDWEGEIITVGNSLVGTLKKFIPFAAEEGWHVPQIMLEMLQARQFQHFYTEKSKGGIGVRRGKLVREFAIEILPDLTAQELKDLGQRQAMARGGSD